VEFHDIDKNLFSWYNAFIKIVEFRNKREVKMIITFAGHANIPSPALIKELVKAQIRNHITSAQAITFYLGGYGDFDEICACACRELKTEYANLELVYITPYMSLSEQRKTKEMQSSGLYDASIYPPIEHVPPRFAISKRNEWMMCNADLIIAYVNHSYGGAYHSIKMAKRQNKKIINICDFL